MGAATTEGQAINAAWEQATEYPHVVPLGDLKEHLSSSMCWCRPELLDGVWVHHSLDRREDYEQSIN